MNTPSVTATNEQIHNGVVFGNLIQTTEDYETEVAATKANVKIPKGTRGVITSATLIRRRHVGNPIVMLEDGYYLPITDGDKPVPFKYDSDFDLEGFAGWILNELVKDLKLSAEEIEKVKDAIGVKDNFEEILIESIANSLCDLGLAADNSK